MAYLNTLIFVSQTRTTFRRFLKRKRKRFGRKGKISIFSLIKPKEICMYTWVSVSLLVSLYDPIDVKTAEPIGPKIIKATRITPWKVYGCSEVQHFSATFFSIVKF